MRKFNFYNGAFAASLLLTVLVVLVEYVESVKSILTAVFSHHWIAKAVLVTIAFAITGCIYTKDKIAGFETEKLAWTSILGSLIIILLFYLVHYIT